MKLNGGTSFEEYDAEKGGGSGFLHGSSRWGGDVLVTWFGERKQEGLDLNNWKKSNSGTQKKVGELSERKEKQRPGPGLHNKTLGSKRSTSIKKKLHIEENRRRQTRWRRKTGSAGTRIRNNARRLGGGGGEESKKRRGGGIGNGDVTRLECNTENKRGPRERDRGERGETFCYCGSKPGGIGHRSVKTTVLKGK